MSPAAVTALLGRLVQLVAAVVAVTLTALSLAESIIDVRHVEQRGINGWKLLVSHNALRAEAFRLGLGLLLLTEAAGMLWFDAALAQHVDWTLSPFVGAAMAGLLAVATLANRRFRHAIQEFPNDK